MVRPRGEEGSSRSAAGVRHHPRQVGVELRFTGEMGLLDHLPRSATVRARTDMTVYRIDGQKFESVLGASPLARSLLELLSRRIRQLEHGRSLVS